MDINQIPEFADKCEKCVVSVGVAGLTVIGILRWVAADSLAGLVFWETERTKLRKTKAEAEAAAKASSV